MTNDPTAPYCEPEKSKEEPVKIRHEHVHDVNIKIDDETSEKLERILGGSKPKKPAPQSDEEEDEDEDDDEEEEQVVETRIWNRWWFWLIAVILLLLIGYLAWYLWHTAKPTQAEINAAKSLVTNAPEKVKKGVKKLKEKTEDLVHKAEGKTESPTPPTSAPAPVVSEEEKAQTLRERKFIQEQREKNAKLAEFYDEREKKEMDSDRKETVKVFVKNIEPKCDNRLWLHRTYPGRRPQDEILFTSKFSHRVWAEEVVPGPYLKPVYIRRESGGTGDKKTSVWVSTDTKSSVEVVNGKWKEKFEFTPTELKTQTLTPTQVDADGIVHFGSQYKQYVFWYDAPLYDDDNIEVGFVPTMINPCDLGVTGYSPQQLEDRRRNRDKR